MAWELGLRVNLPRGDLGRDHFEADAGEPGSSTAGGGADMLMGAGLKGTLCGAIKSGPFCPQPASPDNPSIAATSPWRKEAHC